MIIYYIISNLCYTFSSPQSWNCPATFHTPLTVPRRLGGANPDTAKPDSPEILALQDRKKEGEIAENSLVISPSLDYQPLLHQADADVSQRIPQADAAKREKSGEPVHFGIRRLDAAGIAALCTPAVPGIKPAFYVSICRNNNGSPGSHSRSSRTGVWRSRFL